MSCFYGCLTQQLDHGSFFMLFMDSCENIVILYFEGLAVSKSIEALIVIGRLSVPDHMPNLGLFWYFFMLVFDHFRQFFLWIFQINVFIYSVPLAIRLRFKPFHTTAYQPLHSFLIIENTQHSCCMPFASSSQSSSHFQLLEM